MTHNKLALILLYIIFMGNWTNAQSILPMTQLHKNLLYYNPATTGNEEKLSIGVSYRNQWLGFEGSPSIQLAEAHAPMKNTKIALGLSLMHMSIGSKNLADVNFSYAHRIKIKDGKLALGLRMGINSGKQAIPELADESDIAFNENNESFILPNAGVGLYYDRKNMWFGFSVPFLFGYKASESGEYVLDYDLSKFQYCFMGGKKILLNKNFAIEPSMLLIYSKPYKNKISLNLIGTILDHYEIGTGYRLNESILFIASYNFNYNFSIGYSFDLNIGKYSKILSSNSQEINLIYNFGRKVTASGPRQF